LASDAAKIDDAVVFAQACGLDIAKCDGREHLWIGRNRFVPYSDAARWPNVSAERLAEDPGSARPERHFPSGAAQTNSLGSWNSAGSPQICAIFQRDNLRRHF
jgi:hypothetical protein